MSIGRKILPGAGTLFAIFVLFGAFAFSSLHSRCGFFSPGERTTMNMRVLVQTLDTYYNYTGQWPSGNWTQITRALSGDNPFHQALINPTAFRTNPQGEPVDEWGTRIKVGFEERGACAASAGKDKTFDTADDLAVGEPK